MQWVTILLISVAANIDNLGISVSYGLKSNRIPLLPNLLIAIISMICAFVSVTAGSLLSTYFSQSLGNLIGGSLIISLGVWLVVTSPAFTLVSSRETKTSRQPLLPTVDQAKNIEWKESIFLGFLLALNCLTIGLGAGITGVSAFYTSVSIGIFSMLSISIGVKMGNKIGSTIFGKYSNTAAGFLLIIIGIYEIFI